MGMIDYKQLIERLERQNLLPDVSEAQRESNEWRIHWLKMMNRPKAPTGEYKRLDLISERLNEGDFRCTPNKLLTT